MKCPKCGSENNENSSFCTSCGMQMSQNVTDNNISNLGNSNEQNIQSVPSPKKKKPWGLIIGIILLLLVIIVIFVGLNSSKEEEENKQNGTVTENNAVDKNETPKKEETKTVNYSNFTFKVPEKYITTPSDSQLLILNEDGSLAQAIIYQNATSYSTLSSMKSQVIDLLKNQETSKSQGYDFAQASTEEKTYGGTKFLITSNIKQGTIDIDISYGEAKDGVFVISIVKAKGNITEAERQELYSIVASAIQ